MKNLDTKTKNRNSSLKGVVDVLVKRTQHVAKARQDEYVRQAAQDAASPEATAEGALAAAAILLEGYTGETR